MFRTLTAQGPAAESKACQIQDTGMVYLSGSQTPVSGDAYEWSQTLKSFCLCLLFLSTFPILKTKTEIFETQKHNTSL